MITSVERMRSIVALEDSFYLHARNDILSEEDCEEILASSDELSIHALTRNPSTSSEAIEEIVQRYILKNGDSYATYDVEVIAKHPNVSENVLWRLSDSKFCEYILKSPKLPEKLQIKLFRRIPEMHKQLAANRNLTTKIYEKLYKKHKVSGNDVHMALTLNPSIPEHIAIKLLQDNDLYKNNVISSFKGLAKIHDQVILSYADEVYYLNAILKNRYMGNDFYNKKYDEFLNKAVLNAKSSDLSLITALGSLARNPSIKIDMIEKIKNNCNDPHVLSSLMLNESTPISMVEEIFLKPELSYHWDDITLNESYKNATKILATDTDRDIFRKLSYLFRGNKLSDDFVKQCLQVETHMLVQREACLSRKAKAEDIITCITSWLENDKIDSGELIDVKNKFAGFILDNRKQTYKTLQEYFLRVNDVDISSMPNNMVAELLGWNV
jgi:hypothetical protein